MADPKIIQGGLNAARRVLSGEPRLAELLSHGGDKALPLMLPRANFSSDFINQQAERVARQMAGEHVVSGKPKETFNLAGRSKKESQRVKGLDYKLSPTGTVAQEVPYTPRRGDLKVAVPGDQTVSNKILDEVNGFPIDSVQEGGAYYGLGQRHLADPEFWKSNEEPAKRMQSKVDRVAELYEPDRVIGSHLAMGPMSNNFAMHLADANLRAVDWSKAEPNKINIFDSIIAYGYKDPKTKEMVKFPNWPGLADREGAFAAMKEDPNLRKWFNDRMKTPAVTKPLGLPNGLDIQYAITEPRLRDMEINMTGLMTGELQPGALVEAAGAPHNTYSHRILGEAGGPQEVLTPFVIDFPDAAQHIASTKKPADFTGTIQKVFPHQLVDDQYLNQYGEYRDRIKELTGQKKGGAVDIDAADARLAQAIQARMAKGGAVDMKAADARLEAAINARMAGGGGAFKKMEFMAGGGKLKALGDIGKRFLSDDQVASQAIGKAAESAGMKAPVTANKPLTNLQDVYTSLGDRVNQGAVEMQNLMESMPYKYDKGQRVFTADSVKKNKPPYTILRRVPYGNQPMREDHPDLAPGNKIGKPIIDPATGKTQRTPYEPGYHVRHDGDDGWTEFQIPESAIKGDVEMARGGLLHMADAGRVFKGVKSIGKRFMADPAESSVASARRGERTADQIGGLNIVKETGGNFLTGRTAKDLSPLKRNVGRADETRLNANTALNNWIDSNLTNYVEKQMGTANDPVRLMFDKRAQEIDAKYAKDMEKSDRIAQRATKELDPRKQANLMREAERIKAEANLERQTAVNHISHKPALLDEYLNDPLSGEQMRRAENIKKQRTEAGFSEEGLGQSPMAKAWELASDESIAAHRAGDIQGMPEKYAKRKEADSKMRAAKNELDEKFKQHIENSGLNDREKATLMRRYSDLDKATMLNDDNYKNLRNEYLSLDIPMMDNYMNLGRNNPYISKLDPETRLYAPFTGDLGFDHIIDVLREDLTTGRIRPDQLSKVNMEQAVRRTSEYDQELAAKMNASRAAAREGLPTYREYPEGYKWIELNKPGAFAQESEAMGHSVRGYEPPKGHPDWTEASGDAGSSGYGHGGWEAIKSGKAKVYSLVDSKGEPHTTVEIKAGKPWNERNGIFYDNPELEPSWQRFSQEASLEEKAKGLNRPSNYIERYPEWLKANEPELFAKHARVFENDAPRISQIKGKGNRAPNDEYLPYVQDFVKGEQWSDVGDLRHTGLRRTSDVFGPTEMQKFKENGIELPSHLNTDEQKAMQDKWYTLETGKDPDTGMAQGGGAFKKLQFMADGGKLVKGLGSIGKKLFAGSNVLPAAERDANLAKFLDTSYEKRRLYHATPSDFQEFQGEGFDPTISGNATWLTSNKDKQPAAHNISSRTQVYREGVNVMPVHVKAERPLVLDNKNMEDWAKIVYAKDESPELSSFPFLISPDTIKRLKEDGYDSIFHPRSGEVIMLEPNKIKSATGNRGTYDITDPDISKAEGGPAFKKLQFMDKGGLTTSGGTFSAEELGVTEDDLGINKKFLNNIKRNASEMYDEGKKTLSDDYDRLKASAIARAQLAKIAAAQFAGGLPDLASLATPLVNSDALLSAFPMARAAKIGLTGSPSTGRRTSVLSDEKTPYSLADYTNDINGNPRGGSEDIIKRAQKAGLMYGGTRMMYDAQEPDPSKEMLTMTPEQYEKLLNSEGRNRIDFGEQITTGRFSPVTEMGTAILGGNLGSKLARGAVNTGQKFKKGFDRGYARAMSRQAPPFLRELEYTPSKMRGGLTQLKAR